MIRLFEGKKGKNRSKLENITLRGFGGGWNAVDDDTSMDPKYLVDAKNITRTPSGAQRVRFGNKFYARTDGIVSGDIVDMIYFNGAIVAVMDSGEIAKFEGLAGTGTAIWNTAIAALLPGAPAGWGTGLFTIDFVEWKDQLIIHNGEDKPIILASDFSVTYLQDLATGSNVNVPIGKYGCVVSNYHCIAGIAGAPTTIYISSKSTAGVFPGDPDPNDSISIDVGAYAPEGAPEIRGIAGFKQFLLVFFLNQTLILQLGNYVEDAHEPQFPDTLPKFGILGHRTIATVDNDIRFAGYHGMSSATKNLFSGNLDSKHFSELIEPAYRRELSDLSNLDQLYNVFTVDDPLSDTTMLFTPTGLTLVYAANAKLRYQAWSYHDGATWTSGCTSLLGRVFVALEKRIYQLGNPVYANEDFQADYMDDHPGYWATATVYSESTVRRDVVSDLPYICRVGHTSPGSGTFAAARAANPTYWELYEGDPIEFRMELPWLDGRNPMTLKQNRYIALGTKGTATFNIKAYVDNITASPALTLVLTGNDATGVDGEGNIRRSSNSPSLFGFPVKFKMIKFVIDGQTVGDPLQIINLQSLFARGKYRR